MVRAGWKIPLILFTLLLGMLYAAVAAASVLGMIGIYRQGLVIVFVIAVTAGVAWLYLRHGGWDFFRAVFEQPKNTSLLDGVLLGLGAILIVVLLVIPIAAFPYSPLMDKLNWDAGFYHFPKALELVVSGSVRDLSIAYGEYPFGGEALFALAAVLTRDTALFGVAHLLTVLLLCLSLWFLLRRFTGLPAGVSLFLASLLMLSGALDIEWNVWRIFKFLAYTVGKNDLFVCAALLAAIWHVPMGSRENEKASHWVGFSISAMIALSIKPNAALVILPLWLWVMWTVRERAARPIFSRLPWKQIGISILIMLPGLLWVPRNLIGQGVLFSAGAGELQAWNLLNHLFAPGLLQTFPKTLWLVGGLLVAAVVAAFFLKHVSWKSTGLYALLLAAFAATPGSAILNYWESQTQVVVAWRFGLALLAFGFILVLHWLAPWLVRLYRLLEIRRWLAAAVSLAAVVFVGWFIYINSGVLKLSTGNAWIMDDAYQGYPGKNGYTSPINYIRREVKTSVVWVENGMSYYLYGPGFTNSTSRAGKADYLVFLETNWDGFAVGYPAYLSDPQWQKGWTLVYEDGEGKVFRRNP